jgi:hypothetical protein
MIRNVTGQFYDYRQTPHIIANSPRFAAICRFLPLFAAICSNLLQNARNSLQLIAKRLWCFFRLNPRAPFICVEKNHGPKWGAAISLAPSPPQKTTFSGLFQ